MGTYAVLFPGQGSQYSGMIRSFYDAFSSVRMRVEEASDVMAINVKKLLFDVDEVVLKATENAQPAIFTTSYSIYEILKCDVGLRPAYLAGHSLGQYTALAAAGVFSFGEGVAITRRRGELMAEAARQKKGAMAAVLGLEKIQIEALCRRLSTGHEQVVVANDNAPLQCVVSGNLSCVDLFVEAVSEETGKRCVKLAVSGAFHSPLMATAERSFSSYLAAKTFACSSVDVVSNGDGKIFSKQTNYAEALASHIVSPVLWRASVEEMMNGGAMQFLEVGPGRVLSGLMKRLNPLAKSRSCNAVNDLDAIANGEMING